MSEKVTCAKSMLQSFLFSPEPGGENYVLENWKLIAKHFARFAVAEDLKKTFKEKDLIEQRQKKANRDCLSTMSSN